MSKDIVEPVFDSRGSLEGMFNVSDIFSAFAGTTRAAVENIDSTREDIIDALYEEIRGFPDGDQAPILMAAIANLLQSLSEFEKRGSQESVPVHVFLRDRWGASEGGERS